MVKEIKLDNLEQLNLKEDWKESIERFIKDLIKHDAQILLEDDIIQIIDKTNSLELVYMLYDPNVVVYTDKGRPLGAYSITINYDKILQLIEAN